MSKVVELIRRDVDSAIRILQDIDAQISDSVDVDAARLRHLSEDVAKITYRIGIHNGGLKDKRPRVDL